MFPNEFFGTQYLTTWADYCLNLDVLTCWVEAGVDANPDDELADEYAQEWGLVSWEDAELALVQLEHKKWAGQSESILILYSRYLQAVWPDWAILESYWLQILLQSTTHIWQLYRLL